MKNNLMWIAGTLFGLFLLGSLFGCGGGDSAEDPDFELTNPLVSISTLKNVAVDQFAYFATETSSEPDIEIRILDAESHELLLRSYGDYGMYKVMMEGILYGNLNSGFQKKIMSDNYEGRLFEIVVDHNAGGIGISEPINYDTLISKPIMATNGGFYVRFKKIGDTFSYPMPISVVGPMQKDRLTIDHVYLSHAYEPVYSKISLNVYVTVGEDKLRYGTMIGCADGESGVGPVDYTGINYGRLLADLVDEDEILIKFSEHKGKTVKVIAVDNGGASCPSPIDTSELGCWYGCSGDDVVIAESPALLWDDLPGSQIWLGDQVGYVIFNNIME